MIIWGISANSHDAALAVFKKDQKESQLELLFASHAERYSGVKNDAHLNQALIKEAKHYGEPDEIIWYERPLVKTIRQFSAGQGFNFRENRVRDYLARYGITAPVRCVDHHLSHAAAGYYTSGFAKASVVVIDSIGEFDTFTIWEGQADKLKQTFRQRYPHSVGLWYSALTQRLGLKPQEDEYILMGMAAYGDPDRLYHSIVNDFIAKWPDPQDPSVKFKQNLHRGCLDWRPDLTSEQDLFDIAAATQKVYEHIFEYILQYVSMKTNNPELVLMGGCALNCSANSIALKYFKDVWIMPNPGDSGSAIGSVLAQYKQHIEWPGPYLGHNIQGEYPVEEIIQELKATGICGVANGRSEFGPRALGHRSLLADPRGNDIKDRVNTIKHRQKFRPFAPAILEEYAAEYFDGHTGPYMQYTATCKHPEAFPAIIHADGTSRVQTVGKHDSKGFRKLLERWYAETGCPMLLNTSLNIKGQPIVNDLTDAENFAKHYNIKVF
jgi:carbamoyltransferase